MARRCAGLGRARVGLVSTPGHVMTKVRPRVGDRDGGFLARAAIGAGFLAVLQTLPTLPNRATAALVLGVLLVLTGLSALVVLELRRIRHALLGSRADEHAG